MLSSLENVLFYIWIPVAAVIIGGGVAAVRAKGRTEPEALALLVKAMELHLKQGSPEPAPRRISPASR